MHPRKAFSWLLVVCFVAASTLLLNAQGTGGRILGNVSDPTGALLAGVQVKLVNEQTGVAQNTQTDRAGHYEFPAVPVGNYRLEYEQTGFKKAVKKGLVLQVNQVITMNMTMQVGGAQEVVEVTSEAPLVDTTSTQLGAVVNDRSVAQLPLNARDTYQFLQLQPGVMSQLGGNSDIYYGSDQAGAVSVNGGRGRANNFSVNGGDANDAFVNLPTVQPCPDCVQEFRVLTNTFDAEYGRNSGSVVNVVTKSGTNAFHGNVYEFFRNKVLNARGYFDTVKPQFQQNQFGATFGGPIHKDKTFFFATYEGRRIRQGKSSPVVTVPSLAERAGQFGAGAFGGTITNGSVAQTLAGRPGCQTAIAAEGGSLPLPAPGGAFSPVAYNTVFPTGQIPVPCMDPVAYNLMQQFVPLPNTADGFYQNVITGADTQNQFTVRLDHHITDRQQLSFYYYFTNDQPFQPFAFFEAAGANVPGFGSNTNERWQQYNLSHTWTINNTTVNEARFVYMREAQGEFNHPQTTNLVTNSCTGAASPFCFTGTSDSSGITSALGTNPKYGITPNLGTQHEGVPFISVSGGFVIGNNFEGELPQIGNSFQWQDSITKVKGTHTLKFGADIRRQRFDQFLYYNVNGFFSYFGGGPNDTGYSDLYPNYLLGLPDSYSQGAAQVENVRSTGAYFFGQDSWKIKPNVTLNYGLRWELNTPLTDISQHVQTFRPGQVTSVYPCTLEAGAAALGLTPGTGCNPGQPGGSVFPTGLVVPGDKGVPAGMTTTYYKAFAPRIGLAWSPSADSGILGKLLGSQGKTSIRTGWGMFYNPIEQLVLEQFSAEPPFGGSSTFYNTMFNTPFIYQAGGTAPNPFNGVLNPTPGQAVDWSLFRPILLFGEFQPHLRTQYSDQYNFTIQRELSNSMVLQIGYVGSQGHRLLASHELNPGNAQTCLDLQTISVATNNSSLACGPFFADSAFNVPAGAIPSGMVFHLPNGQTVQGGPSSPALTMVGIRPYSSPQCNYFTGAGCPADGVPVFSNIFAQDTIANSSYNSLQASLERRFSHGLQFEAAYTFSKSIDQASSFEDILNPFNFARTRALSAFDARHRLVLSYYWELPVPKYSGAAGKILNGWAVSGITSFQSGFPIRIQSQDDTELNGSIDFASAGAPNIYFPFRTNNPHNSGCAWGTGPSSAYMGGSPACSSVPNQYFDPNIFQDSALGTYGNAPRNICCGPGLNEWDFAIHKTTQLTERQRVEFRAEFFNLLNHTQFFNPDGNFTDGSQFGQITRARDPRLVQLALKYFF